MAIFWLKLRIFQIKSSTEICLVSLLRITKDLTLKVIFAKFLSFYQFFSNFTGFWTRSKAAGPVITAVFKFFNFLSVNWPKMTTKSRSKCKIFVRNKLMGPRLLNLQKFFVIMIHFKLVGYITRSKKAQKCLKWAYNESRNMLGLIKPADKVRKCEIFVKIWKFFKISICSVKFERAFEVLNFGFGF